MCLITKNKEGLVSDESVVCYKLYQNNVHRQMISPFMGERYNLKEGDEIVAKEGPIVNRMKFKQYMLAQGFIHAVKNKEKALQYDLVVWKAIDFVLMCMKGQKALWRCITDSALERALEELSAVSLCEMEIPAGEKYWIGENGDICAHRMILKRKVRITKKSELLELICLFGVCDCQELIGKYKAKGE